MSTTDPTRSTTRRRRMKQKFRSRWRDLRGDIRRELRQGSQFQPRNNESPSRQVADFRNWFEAQVTQGVIEPVTRTSHVEHGAHYTGSWVRELYKHGIRLAEAELAKDDDYTKTKPSTVLRKDFRRANGPGSHQDELKELMVRVHQDLVDAGRAVVKDVSRSYRDKVQTNASLSETISAVNDRIDKVGQNRTDLIASTISVLIINRATLQQYESAGVKHVGVAPERLSGTELNQSQPAPPEGDGGQWATAGDERVCPECAALAGQVFSIEDIRNGDAPMPVRNTHPGCRCFIVPAQ